MLQGLLSSANQLLDHFNRSLFRSHGAAHPTGTLHSRPPEEYGPLCRVIVTDGVAHTLFEEYAAHLKAVRGEEETGWVLLGLRQGQEAVILATLPAGAERDASVAHVRFNSDAQALGSRMVRQSDRRLTTLGVVHTHPGSLRHPSDGDFRGDSHWVKHLRGKEGVFAIGTADGDHQVDPLFARQPKPHVQCLGELRLSWYVLKYGDTSYRPLPLELTIGPDLARPLHQIWTTIEAHAERLERLASQQAKLHFAVVPGEQGFHLAVSIPLAEPGNSIRVLLMKECVRYFLQSKDKLEESSLDEIRVDRGVYLILAELAVLSP